MNVGINRKNSQNINFWNFQKKFPILGALKHCVTISFKRCRHLISFFLLISTHLFHKMNPQRHHLLLICPAVVGCKILFPWTCCFASWVRYRHAFWVLFFNAIMGIGSKWLFQCLLVIKESNATRITITTQYKHFKISVVRLFQI